ncbi:G-type lectin S-receptor-like serine/threonine-protein kinase CES101 [Pistacia vera]|uniref:G-type lectin S-receptor-like serine/threonine-protein kinase CES101 n=1 Tax=Pistacia vera TaxID=55513 RepID=UPI00126393FA|nr:G-type lectin S-receptor-like serine/threonine-protein kinase CES101 [Pistacia vera]
MRAAVIPTNDGNSLQFYWQIIDRKVQYYVYCHFLDVEVKEGNQSREMNIFANGKLWYGPFIPNSSYTTIVVIDDPSVENTIKVSINQTENSTQLPILNALEIYTTKEFPQLLADQQDVDAILKIKAIYGVKRNWQGDPCAPKAYLWQGLNCSYNEYKPPRIISLNLSRNKLKGSVPTRLMEKMEKGLLSLRRQMVVIIYYSRSSSTGSPVLLLMLFDMENTQVENIKNQEKLLREFGDNLSPSSADGKRITEDKNGNIKHELNIFKFQTIVAATNNFSTTNVLGKGGFGAVYKGILLDGQEIPKKRLSKSSNQGIEEFQNEAKLIAKLQHTNLVRLLGCSLQAEERILIYEYIPNKSLDFFIFDSHRKKLLNWKIRFNIIEEVAQGLIYLHKYSRLRVIHRDLKVANILLDDQMNPKIYDFGIARIFGVNESIANTNRIVGTYGYMSPKYAMNGIVSIKIDVYNFGVLVLEIVSGKKNNGCYHTEHPLNLNLVGYTWQLWNEGKGLELMDPTMDESCSPDEVLDAYMWVSYVHKTRQLKDPQWQKLFPCSQMKQFLYLHENN